MSCLCLFSRPPGETAICFCSIVPYHLLLAGLGPKLLNNESRAVP